MITTQALNGKSRVRHGFFTRQGGVSEGLFSSLNCGFGSGDNPDHIAANRSLAIERLGREGDVPVIQSNICVNKALHRLVSV